MPEKEKDESLSDDPLKPWENRRVRQIIRRDERVLWLGSWLRLLAGYMTGAVVAWWTFQEALSKIIKAWFR